MKKFTFKTEHPTGAYRYFFPSYHLIKLGKKQVGNIIDRSWKIRLMVVKKDIMEDGNPNCEWRWITLAKESQSLQEAKDWLNENMKAITDKYTLHLMEL